MVEALELTSPTEFRRLWFRMRNMPERLRLGHGGMCLEGLAAREQRQTYMQVWNGSSEASGCGCQVCPGPGEVLLQQLPERSVVDGCSFNWLSWLHVLSCCSAFHRSALRVATKLQDMAFARSALGQAKQLASLGHS